MTGIGLAIPADTADDHFIAALVHSLAEPLIARGIGLFTRVVHDARSEERMYRHWAESETMAGVVVLGARHSDSRIRLLQSLGLPFAAVVDTEGVGDYPAVVVDVSASVTVVAEFLGSRGPERTVYITGPSDTVTARSRAAAAAEWFEVVHTDRDPASAVAAASAAIAAQPATLLFDSDVHAAAAIGAFAARGLRAPDDVPIISWTDSSLCQSMTPSITAVNRRGAEIGALLGARMVATVDGGDIGWDAAPPPFIVRRESA